MKNPHQGAFQGIPCQIAFCMVNLSWHIESPFTTYLAETE